MTKNKSLSESTTLDPELTEPEEPVRMRVRGAKKNDEPAPEAFANIRAHRDSLVRAVIDRTLVDGSYQAVKWLFEFGHINAAEQNAPEDEPSLLRLLLEKLQIEETPEELAAKFAAEDGVLE